VGIFTSKIALGILAGGFTLAGAGLLFNGTETLDRASAFVQNSGERLTQFEANENSLISKIGLIKDDANSKISTANTAISGLEADKVGLEVQVATLDAEIVKLNDDIVGLKGQIITLEADLLTEKGNHDKTKALLEAKTKEYNNKVAELVLKNAQVSALNTANQALVLALAKAGEEALKADKLVAELEKEIERANKEVEAHGAVVDAVKAETETAQPSTQDEIDAIDITLDEVVIGSDSN